MGQLYQLPSVTFAAGGNATTQLKDLPAFLRGRIPHVRRFIYEVDYTPTTTALPTTVGNNNLVNRCDFWDGRINRFIGGFNHLRMRERLSNGQVRVPDADTDIASGTARYFRRVLHVGPPNFINANSDFLIACAALAAGEIRWGFGALTDLAADCTAATGTVRPFADLTLLDEVRIPPACQFQFYSASGADVPLPGRALYVNVALLNSASFDAIAAGDFDTFRFDLGQGDIVPSIMAESLNAAYNDDYAVGDLEPIQGEPRGASDDNTKQVNHATPTAIVAQTADLQVVTWTPPRAKLTKLELAETSARLQWTGSQGTGVVLVDRILSQPASVIGSLAAQVCGALGKSPKSIAVKSFSKKPYDGPYVEFMPYVVKV